MVRLFAGSVAISRGATLEETSVPLIELGFETAEGPPGSADPAAEARARWVLEGFGAVDLDCVDEVAVAPGCRAQYALGVDGDVHSYCEFSRYVLPQLRELGWRVTVDASYPYQIVDGDAPWYAEVRDQSERSDWFGLELGIELDGARVNLLHALIELLESSGWSLDAMARRALPRFAVRVSDTHCATIPADRLRAMLRVLAELYSGDCGANHTLFTSAALARLERELGCNVIGWGQGQFADRGRRLVAPPEQPMTLPPGLTATLRPYQLRGLAWLQNLRELGAGGILADDMGLGKTLQTIAHLSLEKALGHLRRPALIVAPTTLVSVWRREIARFAPHLRTAVIHGASRGEAWARAGGASVIITSYPILVRDQSRFAELELHMLILDEAQTIKNRRSQVHAAAKSLSAEHRLCLTGTPLENNLGELWTLMDFVEPGLLGSEEWFARAHRAPIEQRGDRERLAALRERVAPHVLRRMKAEVATELPRKTELLRPVTLRGAQRDLYEAIRVAAHARVRRAIDERGLARSTVSVLDALMKLRQVCCDPRLVAIDAASQVTQSAKLEAFFELLDALLADRHRVLVFSQFTTMLGLIADGLGQRRIGHAALTGSTQRRDRVIDRFQRGEVDVFLISLKAGGTGLTLTEADTIIHYDPWWNPAAQDQATDRAYRIGQTRPVFAYTLFAAGSVEERILALQRRKRELAAAILGGTSASAALTRDEIDALFAPLTP